MPRAIDMGGILADDLMRAIIEPGSPKHRGVSAGERAGSTTCRPGSPILSRGPARYAAGSGKDCPYPGEMTQWMLEVLAIVSAKAIEEQGHRNLLFPFSVRRLDHGGEANTSGGRMLAVDGGAYQQQQGASIRPPDVSLCLDSKTGESRVLAKTAAMISALCLDSKTGESRVLRNRLPVITGFALIPKPGRAE